MQYTKEQMSFINQLLDVKFNEASETGFAARVLPLSERANALGVYTKLHSNVSEDGKVFVDAELDFSMGEKAFLKKIMEEPMPLSSGKVAEEILVLLV